ncbi:Origin recognition complex subunit 2 [Coemansia sp. RSA 989]|nr:Origin recognition complex subunit 2 [Coemansia sp. RSA 989]KAJ1872511.1 Origin recognition complex subunit 2 [Coemansia sp. RSA 990]KAJ2629929.1 Origin recognition complex subunit 2 [Coemansia sp. RSA 1290]KAJ2653535.1 Origin recognition complex subunit 2 [Coemansia sp. RSA 1250]KAJ2677250.1 Origin recognition complex subunit 2 [Coemansia sp. RSA 1085]
MKENDNRMTPRRGARASTRFDMGMTLSTIRRGRKTLLTDPVHSTPTRASTSEITDILKLGAVVEAEDKENSSEEASGICAAAGQEVYGFQQRAARKRGANGSQRGNKRAARGGRGGRAGDRMLTDKDEGEEEEEEEEEELPQRTKAAVSFNGNEGDSSDEGDADSGFNEQLSFSGPAYERYFQNLHTTKGPQTSDNTLSKLPLQTQAESRALLSKVPVKHKSELALLESLHRRQFRQWYFEMSSGFNIVFYGYGSKRRLINAFASELGEHAPVAIINGYFPTLNLKQSLEKIAVEILDLGITSGSIADLAALIHGYFSSSSCTVDEMYVVVHNIDGPCLRKHQAALAVLASSPRIHVLASIDHIEAPLIWDTSTITRFNWAWHDLTTFEPYTVETSYENFTTESKEIGPRGVLHVLASLTENAKGIFRVLAEYQIAEAVMDEDAADTQKKSGSNVPEMSYSSYFTACRDQFLVTNEMTFRSQLTEFRDHKVIQSRHAPDGTEFVFIPLSATVLGTILESMD